MRKSWKIDFESKPVCADDKKYIKKKIKTYEKSIITNYTQTKKRLTKTFHASVYQ